MLNSTVPKYSTDAARGAQEQDLESPEPHTFDGGVDHSSTCELGPTPTPQQQENRRERKHNTYLGLLNVLEFFWGGVYAPGPSTHNLIE